MKSLSKMKILLIVVASVITVAALTVVIVCVVSHKTVTDKGGMENNTAKSVDECVYSLYGGMEGESLNIRLSADENGSAVIESSRVPSNGAPEETKKLSVPFEAVEKIRDVCKKYGVMSWEKLKYSEIIATDAPTVSLTFSVKEENISVTVNSNQELPEGCNGIFNEVYDILMSYLQGDD
ncbi:MAG: hypothetical protein ACI4I3_02830 [Acutalibacteraceae bacterium]